VSVGLLSPAARVTLMAAQASSAAILGLFRLAVSAEGRMRRSDVTSGAHAMRVTGEDLAWLTQKGYIDVSSKNWIGITERGNELVRRLVQVANTLEGAGCEAGEGA
jgi:hypothetical protein